MSHFDLFGADVSSVAARTGAVGGYTAAEKFSVSGTLALFSASTETMIRDLGTLSADLSLNRGDAFISFLFRLKNTGPSAEQLTGVYCMIDDTVRGDWGDFELAAGAKASLHVYSCNMARLAPGLHRIELYVNGKLLAYRYFSLNDSWSSLMRLPSAAEIAAYDRTAAERSTYASLYFGFRNSTFSEAVVDFRAADQPDCTYLCPFAWWMDTSRIAGDYRTIDACRAAYCGFQTDERGRIAIMSIWDTAYTDKKGSPGLIKARLTYHKPGTEYLMKVAEGDEQGAYTSSYASCRLSYDWQAGHWYRALLRCGTSKETGNKTISFWVCDLEADAWELLMVFDLGMPDTHITGLSSFLECYSPSSAGEVRTMELANARAYNDTNGTWEDAYNISFRPGGCLHPELSGSGSCRAVCDGHTFRVITSGIPGLAKEGPGKAEFAIASRDHVPPRGPWAC